MGKEEIIEQLVKKLNWVLTAQEKFVLAYLYGLNKKGIYLKPIEISRHLEVSPMRITDLRERAVKKLSRRSIVTLLEQLNELQGRE